MTDDREKAEEALYTYAYTRTARLIPLISTQDLKQLVDRAISLVDREVDNNCESWIQKVATRAKCGPPEGRGIYD